MELKDLPPRSLRAAPRITQTNEAGATVRVVDPEWSRRRLEPKRETPIAQRVETPSQVLREIANRSHLPIKAVSRRDKDFVRRVSVEAMLAIRRRCPSVSWSQIASMFGFSDYASAMRYIREFQKSEGESR